LRLEDFDYSLPRERIAQRPLAEREASRMLLLDRKREAWEDRLFRDLPELLSGNELIVVNNVRVLPARLLGHRVGIHAEPPGRRARREFLHSPIEVLLVRQVEPGVWEALVRPGRKVRTGERIRFGDGELEGEVTGRGDYGLRQLKFTARAGFEQALEHLGHVPLPPYIKRPDEPADHERYQTIFARQGHAVAAPTAGLHFSETVLAKLRARAVEFCEITLEVGLGTFEPIRTRRVEDHRMHCEVYEIPEAAASAIVQARREKRPILAVGTTVVRALEDAALKSAAQSAGDGEAPLVRPGRAEADLFIYPGHQFRVVDELLTNFHLPKSSLLVMVAAFAGREFILRAYRHAVEEGYRFYSYGDCMLIRGTSRPTRD
jgi:S-adenosylmethionine:tRNA ribosyltransferase-isomerase